MKTFGKTGSIDLVDIRPLPERPGGGFYLGEHSLARINIENKWWEDPRRTTLIGLLGNPYIVDGVWFGLVRQAQLRFNTNSKGLISLKLVKAYPHWEDFLNEGLLEIRGDEIYVSGTDEHFAWMKESEESGSRGGKISAKRPRDEKGRLLPKDIQGLSKGALDAGSNGPRVSNPPPLTLSLKKETTTTKMNIMPEMSEQIDQAYSVWNDTRNEFGLPPSNISPVEQGSIYRALKQIGLENTLLALEGQRFEPSNDKFNPINHLRLDRVLHRDAKGQSRWESFRDMALANRSKQSSNNEEEEARRIAEHGRSTV